MYSVTVHNGCSCFLKSGLSSFSEFGTKQEAKEEAESMLRIMNSNFCHKHRFSLSENMEGFAITITPAR